MAALLAEGRVFEREIGQLRGIKSVKLVSSVTSKVRITLDPARIASKGIDPSGIAAAIGASNLNLPAGQLDLSADHTSILVVGALGSLSALAEVPLRSSGGALVRLGDVSTIDQVVDQHDTQNHIGYLESGHLVSRPGLVPSVRANSA